MKAVIVHGLRRGIDCLRRFHHRQRKMRVPFSQLVQGGESGIPGQKYARLIGDFMRTSRPVADWPHVEFLRDYSRLGEKVFERGTLENTRYFQNAKTAIEFTGSYFEARSYAQIDAVCRNFAARLTGKPNGFIAWSEKDGHSPRNQRIRVVRLLESDHFMTVDGHHRVSLAFLAGDSDVEVMVESPPQLTAAQELLRDVLWQQGRSELYQPVDVPECSRWQLVRKCTDRYHRVQTFLHEQGIGKGSSYLDVGSSYGWFVREAIRDGLIAHGVERDPLAIAVGEKLYGLPAERFTRAECSEFLKGCARTWDAVSCFSVLHHFALGKGSVPANEFIRLLDNVTGKVLLFDTGESHEAWFKNSLSQWNADFIEKWVATNTSFKTIIRLGRDDDNVGAFQGNYNRMLFACLR